MKKAPSANPYGYKDNVKIQKAVNELNNALQNGLFLEKASHASQKLAEEEQAGDTKVDIVFLHASPNVYKDFDTCS